MKRWLIVFLAFAITACGGGIAPSPSSTEAPPAIGRPFGVGDTVWTVTGMTLPGKTISGHDKTANAFIAWVIVDATVENRSTEAHTIVMPTLLLSDLTEVKTYETDEVVLINGNDCQGRELSPNSKTTCRFIYNPPSDKTPTQLSVSDLAAPRKFGGYIALTKGT